MTKYSIDQALLAASSGREDQPAGRRIAVDNPYEMPKTSLLQAVAVANRCRVVWLKDVGLATVVGFEADLDAVEVLFTSLLVQADTAMLRAGSKQDAYGASRTRAFRQSFLVSYAIRIGERLAETAEHTTQEAAAERAAAAGGTAPQARARTLVPFLAARRQAVDDAVDEIFDGAVLRGRPLRVTDADGWVSGIVAAADLASLHNRSPAVARPADEPPARLTARCRSAGSGAAGRAAWRIKRISCRGAQPRQPVQYVTPGNCSRAASSCPVHSRGHPKARAA